MKPDFLLKYQKHNSQLNAIRKTTEIIKKAIANPL